MRCLPELVHALTDQIGRFPVPEQRHNDSLTACRGRVSSGRLAQRSGRRVVRCVVFWRSRVELFPQWREQLTTSRHLAETPDAGLGQSTWTPKASNILCVFLRLSG